MVLKSLAFERSALAAPYTCLPRKLVQPMQMASQLEVYPPSPCPRSHLLERTCTS